MPIISSRDVAEHRAPPPCSTMVIGARPGSFVTMASSDELHHVAPAASCAASMLRRSLTSRNTSTTPLTAPFASRIGAALSSMARSRAVAVGSAGCGSASPTTRALRQRALGRARRRVWRVLSSTIGTPRSSGWPSASSTAHPVSSAATAFSEVTRPRTIRGDHARRRCSAGSPASCSRWAVAYRTPATSAPPRARRIAPPSAAMPRLTAR